MKTSAGRKVFSTFNVIIMVIILCLTIYPFINQLALSFSSSHAILTKTVSVWPLEFTTKTYQDIMQKVDFWVDYKNTLVYTAFGTFLSLILTTIAAYALSKKKLVGKNVILYIFVFTMYFGGGLIPTFVLFKNLGFVNQIWAVIVPNLILPYHILLMKSYFDTLPDELEDAASIDGMSQFGYFCRVVVPLSKPIIATMILFIGVIYWNDWFNALIYFTNKNLMPVTIYLKNTLAGSMVSNGARVDSTSVASTPTSIQAASMLIVILPIMLIYPKVQKHFTKGVMLGAIKG